MPDLDSKLAPRRTYRSAASALGRPPVRVEIPSGASHDPLMPRTPFGVDPSLSERETDSGLGELIDRAASQTLVLRRAVDEAAAGDRSLRRDLQELANRLEQGQRFAGEFDRRLAEAGQAAVVLEKASGALRGLEQVVEHIRAAQSQVHARFEQKLDEARAQFERRLRERESELDARLIKFQETTERRIADLVAMYDGALERITAQAQAAEQSSQTHTAELRRRATEQGERLAQTIDRHAADAHARVSVILNSASDRLRTLEVEAEGITGPARAAMDRMCQDAQKLLGIDPRTPDIIDITPGSLAAAIAEARALVERVDSAKDNVDAYTAQAQAATAQLERVCEQARSISTAAAPELVSLQDAVISAIDQARQAQAKLDAALTAQDQARQVADAGSTRLATLREDLDTMSAAARYHVAQAQQAGEVLRTVIEQAETTRTSLATSIEEAAGTSKALIDVGRVVGELIAKAPAAPSTPASA